MPALLLVRHAQASFGSEDYDVLSELGRRQARVLAESFGRRGVRPALLLSGDLRRQRETAAALPPSAGGAAEVDAGWNEYEIDPILAAHSDSGLRFDTPRPDGPAIDTRAFQALLDSSLGTWVEAGTASPCELTHPRFAAAVDAALDRAFERLGPGETGVAVSSGGAIAAVCAALVGCPERSFVPLNRVQANTGVSKIVRGRSGTALMSFNDTSHLDEADPALISYR